MSFIRFYKTIHPIAAMVVLHASQFLCPAQIDHAAYLENLGSKQFENGEKLYQGLCVNCHGPDGINPTLPTAPAFGLSPLNFGLDPFSMWKTLTDGNGLMAPQTWMSETERYDVVHYIREKFMRGQRDDFVEVNDDYLADLQKPDGTGKSAGRSKEPERDFGQALASQLEKRVVSALTIKLSDTLTTSYNLHTMDIADTWTGGFLDLSETQHTKLRGEGVPEPGGEILTGLQHWKWAHEGTLDYPTADLLPRGPLPKKWVDYKGHHRFGDKVILNYEIDGRMIFEQPAATDDYDAIVHRFSVAGGTSPLLLQICRRESAGTFNASDQDGYSLFTLSDGTIDEGGVFVAVALATAWNGGKENSHTVRTSKAKDALLLDIGPSQQTQSFILIRYAGEGKPQLESFMGFAKYVVTNQPLRFDFKELQANSKPVWNDIIETKGEVAPNNGQPYVMDTLTLPESTPWNTWFRTAALAFHEDGRLFVATHGGDIWVVSEIDESLENLRWKRFASGLYEPFGMQVFFDWLFVTCKDGIVRLLDSNSDGEAEYYESYCADSDVSTFFHSYNFGLEIDENMNLYYAKAGQYTDHALPGAVIKVLGPGPKGIRKVFATGFRTPNGTGRLPDGRITVSDNQGNWIPASKVSVIKPGGFYGYSQTHADPRGRWAPDGGRIDHKKVIPPTSFEQPLIWMPQDYDNSSGGQLWVGDERWGPLSGHLIHTSFGKGWMYYFLMQDLGGATNAAIVRIPIDFPTGIQRAKVNPKDGQVYTVGLNGWNGNGRPGLGEGGVYRVRYTGEEARLVTDFEVRKDAIVLGFNFELDETSVIHPDAFRAMQWNYRWSAAYGSKHWSVEDPNREGADPLNIQSVEIFLPGGNEVSLVVPGLKPVHQIRMQIQLQSSDGREFSEELLATINHVPD